MFIKTVVLLILALGAESCTHPGAQLTAPSSCNATWKDDESHPLIYDQEFENCTFEMQHIIATLDNGLDWEIWENPNETGGHVYDLGKATFYGGEVDGKPQGAYRAEWSNSGDFISRAGLQFEKVDPSDKTKMKKGCSYKKYGAITAEYNFKKSGKNTAGGYSYVGIYGWARNPLLEYYIIDNWFGNENLDPDVDPVPPATVCNDVDANACKIGEYELDGGTYILYSKTRGPAYSISGPGKCFTQIYAVRKKTRTCGTIQIDKHFQKWEEHECGLVLNEMYETKILVEAGGGKGWIDFTHLTVTKEKECTDGDTYTGGVGNYPSDTYSCPADADMPPAPNNQIKYCPALVPKDDDGAEMLWNKKAWMAIIVLWVAFLLF